MKTRLLIGIGVIGLATLLAACGSGSESTTTATNAALDPTTTTVTTSSTSEPATTVAPKEPVSAYFIGNSLTWDTLGAKPDRFLGLDILVRQADFKFQPNGYHIRCGSSLEDIRLNPTETCVDPDPATGPLDEAFPSDRWDIVTVQPYPGSDSTLLTDERMIKELIEATPDDTRIFILTGWPPAAEFEETWTLGVEDADTTPTQLARSYFDLLAKRLEGDRSVTVIPIGEVLFRFGQRLQLGEVAGFTDVSDLYRDDIHLNEQGSWIAGVTAAATILDVDPTTFGKPRPPWYGDNAGFSSAFIDLARRVISDVLESSS